MGDNLCRSKTNRYATTPIVIMRITTIASEIEIVYIWISWLDTSKKFKHKLAIAETDVVVYECIKMHNADKITKDTKSLQKTLKLHEEHIKAKNKSKW